MNASLLVSEADNTCDVVSAIADGSYDRAAFHVIITNWTDYDAGSVTLSVSSEGDPAVFANAYILLDGVGASLPMDGSGGTVWVSEITPGGSLTGTVNVDDFGDAARGAEGPYNACYCDALSGFTLPLAPF
jgi:hypothetical protein